MFFTSLNGDVFVTDGMTLGGAAIKDDGTWDGKFSEIPSPSRGRFNVDLPPATAVIPHLQ